LEEGGAFNACGVRWLGIDISPTACRVMAKRLRDVCGLPESERSGAPDAASSAATCRSAVGAGIGNKKRSPFPKAARII
jgi:hypothetical protein